MAPFSITTGPGPLVAAAIHDGHAVYPDTLPHLALDEPERLREEDPFFRPVLAILQPVCPPHKANDNISSLHIKVRVVKRKRFVIWDSGESGAARTGPTRTSCRGQPAKFADEPVRNTTGRDG